MIFEEALSPLQCESIADSAEFIQLDVNSLNQPMMTSKHTDLAHQLIESAIRDRQQLIEDHYKAKIQNIDLTRVQWQDSTVAPAAVCDNSVRVKDKWLRIHNRDLTALLFLSDYNERPPFDSDFEVYGGKIEFPSHQFGFNPIRGTMVLYPSDPHFAHVFSKISLGNLFITKTFIQLNPPLIYKPSDFPGSWQQWLEGVV